jgi:hypothetical protein
MIRRLSQMCLLIAAAALAAPAAHAFTLENDPKDLPKFDFDEQLRQFRSTPQLDTSTSGSKKGYETPFGTMQFGVTRGNSLYMSPFGSAFGSSNSGNADRRHYERMFVHPDLQHKYD